MKIQSHDLSMQSQHISYKSIIEQELSFSTYFTSPDETEASNNELSERFSLNEPRTLNSIIQNLIKILSKRSTNNSQAQEPVGVSKVSYFQKYTENETLDFSTSGLIKTDKGCIDINLNFSMSRSFVVENQIDIYTPFDPLVINLNGEIPDLSTDTFSFDLDNDGECDQISKLKEGSGFLALDKNSDNIINQGSELFGTLSGNGFDELREYDEDKNSWIDENDSIFDKLQIWFKNDENREKELVGLGEVGIGAIFLDSHKSEFTYKTTANQTLGEMKSCSMFLKENGECGNISQIDFALKDEPLAQLLQV